MASHSPLQGFNWISFFALTLLAMASLAQAAAPVSAFTHEYRLKSQGIPFSLTATRSLKPLKDGGWELEVRARNWLGEIRETARFAWQGCTPQSRYYGYLRRGLGTRKEAKVHLDREAGQAASERTDKATRHYAIDTDTTDELSLSLALQCHLQQGSTQITLPVADERSMKHQQYLVVGEERVKIDGQRLKTLKVQRLREKDSKRQTYLWFAPAYDYALVKLLQHNEDGDHKMTLKELPSG